MEPVSIMTAFLGLGKVIREAGLSMSQAAECLSGELNVEAMTPPGFSVYKFMSGEINLNDNKYTFGPVEKKPDQPAVPARMKRVVKKLGGNDDTTQIER